MGLESENLMQRNSKVNVIRFPPMMKELFLKSKVKCKDAMSLILLLAHGFRLYLMHSCIDIGVGHAIIKSI
jgi:hypothetical protein